MTQKTFIKQVEALGNYKVCDVFESFSTTTKSKCIYARVMDYDAPDDEKMYKVAYFYYTMEDADIVDTLMTFEESKMYIAKEMFFGIIK